MSAGAFRVVAWALLLLFAPAAHADNCFEHVSNTLNQGSSLTLHLTDGTTVKGKLQFLDVREKSLLLAPPGMPAVSYSMRDITGMDYRRHTGSVGWIIGGSLGGMVMGGTLGYLLTAPGGHGIPNPEPDPRVLVTLGGAVLGFASGLVLGLILPSLITHPESIACTAAP